MFANPLGLLTLLAIPAILAINFLQRKSTTISISTLFLLERTQREAASGRRLERLIPSIPLWMQLLSVVILAWLLSEPRFKKVNSVQRVAIVIDSSASMTVFKKQAIEVLREKLPELQGVATAMELTLLRSTPGADRLYAGSSTEDLLAALEKFTPDEGLSDISHSLRLARSIVSKNGILIYVTDTPAEVLPYDAQLISVGNPVGNVGFTGVSFSEKEGTLTWQAIVKNYGDTTTRRSWSMQTKGSITEPSEFDIAAKSFVTIQAAYPEGAESVRLVLAPDDFTLDDTLPIIAPQPKQLNLYTATSPVFRELTERLLRSLPSIRPSNDAASSDLVIHSYDPLDPSMPEANAVLFMEDPTSIGTYLKGGIIAEAHPLLDGLNWQGLLVRETLQLPRLPSDHVLLWQEKRPLIFLREASDARMLCFNFDLRLSNATRQPAFIVLLHRFANSIRERKVAYQALNLETGQPIHIAAIPSIPVNVTGTDVFGAPVPAPPQGYAPSLPGFFTITQDDVPLLSSAVHFADTREADLSACAPTAIDPILNTATIEIHTASDPFSRLWLLILLAALSFSWCFAAVEKTDMQNRGDGERTFHGAEI